MKTHRDLEVWRASIDLARSVYDLTRQYPKEELFGLVSQMRRASVSIASNIAEGAARNGNKEFREPLKIASHVGWVKPRRRRTQQNHIVRRVSLRFTHPTFELLEVPFMQFLYIALGSASELDTQVEISRVIRICEEDHLQTLQKDITRVRMLISGLIRSLK